MNTPSQEILQKYVADGLITERSHPDYSHIKIYNYTPECAYSKKWDDVTTQCRGLIIDTLADTVLARPFPKFFNYEEYIANGGVIPSDSPMVTEKLDGSLGILYFIDDKPWVATRGSFTSDQAQFATAWVRQSKQLDLVRTFNRDWTYLFEIIYPENKIVVNYDFSGLVWLGAIHTGKGIYEAPCSEAVCDAFKLPEVFRFLGIDTMKNADISNKEGYVLHYQNGLMLKLKFDTYCKLHKTLTGLSEIGVWELLQENGINTPARKLVGDMPDEFYGWLSAVTDRLYLHYTEIDRSARAVHRLVKDMPTRKEQAAVIAQQECVPSVVFSMLDGKDYSKIIYKLIRPSGKKTFTQDTEI